MKKELVIALDSKGHKVVVINEILFYGKKNLPWDKVEQYLKRYIGKVVVVAETSEEIHIGSDFPDEYKGSEDTRCTKGQYAKAKANAAQGIEEMITIAKKTSETNVIIQYNVYLATLIVRKDHREKLHLYDIVHVKKESSLDFSF